MQRGCTSKCRHLFANVASGGGLEKLGIDKFLDAGIEEGDAEKEA